MTPAAAAPALVRLAEWAAALTPDSIPVPVRDVAVGALVDTLGVAVAGSAMAQARLARAVISRTHAPGRASVFGWRASASAAGAALVNGAAAHALDFDDNCYAGVVHGSAVIVPTALALAEERGASGAGLLAAIVAGSEVEYAIGEALSVGPYERGWWTTGLYGAVGATAAAAHILQLSPDCFASALGLAIAGAGGAKSAFGTDGKALLAGRAAETGIVAALLAAEGATGPTDALEHKAGMARLIGAEGDGLSAFEMPGERWRLLAPGLDVKRIPICLSAHAAVDALRDLIAEHGVRPDDVLRIVADVPPIVAGNLGYERPATPTEARFSMPFALAATLLHGDVGLAELGEDIIADPRLRALMDRVAMVSGDEWRDPARRAAAPEGARVTAELTDGTRLQAARDIARGSAADPLTAGEIDAKFLGCAGHLLAADEAWDLLGRARAVETLSSAADLFSPITWETL